MLWSRPGSNQTQRRPRSVAAGRYTLGSMIGWGSATEVYRAYDERLGRPVAVKLFDTSVAGVEQAQQRCAVSTLAGLNHPSVVVSFPSERGGFLMLLGPGFGRQARG